MKEMKIYHATKWLKYEEKVIMSNIYWSVSFKNIDLSVSKDHNYSYSDAVKVWPRFHSIPKWADIHTCVCIAKRG
jgi:hypothetical protein